MFLEACLNGKRTTAQHAAVPITAEQLAADAAAAVVAGADAIHVHPRGADGAETLAPAVIGAAIAAIRRACPRIGVGVSTGAWILPDPSQRLAAIAAWEELPDFVSVNLAEEGVPGLCDLLAERGIEIEAGVWDEGDVTILGRLGLAHEALRVMLEPGEGGGPVKPRALAIVKALDELGSTAPRLLHSVDAAAWPALDLALELGYATRIGLEDTLYMPDLEPARDNAALVAEARRRAAGAA